MRRLIIILLVLCSYAFARGSGSHSQSSRHSTPHSSKSSNHSKTVHVREYTRKDGTVVRAHDRRPPGTASGTYRVGHVAEGYTAHSSVQRDSHGKIKRSKAARSGFMHQQPCPATGKTSGRCPGYVVDHVKALECGGADDPNNMQWQTVEAAKAKDKTEHLCR